MQPPQSLGDAGRALGGNMAPLPGEWGAARPLGGWAACQLGGDSEQLRGARAWRKHGSAVPGAAGRQLRLAPGRDAAAACFETGGRRRQRARGALQARAPAAGAPVHRQQQLLGSALLLGGLARPAAAAPAAPAASATVFHEVALPPVAGGEGVREPPTRWAATGRIVASEHGSSQPRRSAVKGGGGSLPRHGARQAAAQGRGNGVGGCCSTERRGAHPTDGCTATARSTDGRGLHLLQSRGNLRLHVLVAGAGAPETSGLVQHAGKVVGSTSCLGAAGAPHTT
jgi:hypothetical protein